MSIALDHLIVPVHDRRAAARRLGELLDVRWSASAMGPFSPVYVNDGLTLDFDEADGPLPALHCCFRVDDAAFDAILARIRASGLPFRSTPHGPDDRSVNTSHGGRIVYWDAPAPHIWEILTVSYARAP